MLTLAGWDPFVGKLLEGLYRSFGRLQLVWLRTGSKRSFGTDSDLNEEEGPVQWEQGYETWKLICSPGLCQWTDETLLPFPHINLQLISSFLSLACIENYCDSMGVCVVSWKSLLLCLGFAIMWLMLCSMAAVTGKNSFSLQHMQLQKGLCFPQQWRSARRLLWERSTTQMQMLFVLPNWYTETHHWSRCSKKSRCALLHQ